MAGRDATRGLSKHESSDIHKTSTSALSTKANVTDMLSASLAKKELIVITMLKVVCPMCFLADYSPMKLFL